MNSKDDSAKIASVFLFACIVIFFLVTLTGCAAPAYQWEKTEDIQQSAVRKVELDADTVKAVCGHLLAKNDRGCSLRVTNSSTKTSRCVVLMAANDGEAAAHEAGGHCLGYDHPKGKK